mgnify:FL=1
MPTISQLPSEIIYHTLELGADEEIDYKDRQAFLRVAAPVCRSWRNLCCGRR